MKSAQTEFSKHAKEYNSNNIIQQIVSRALIRELESEPKRILELGCGSGQVFKNIEFEFEYYKAIDFSPQMCKEHPKAKNLDVVCLNFDTEKFKQNIENEQYDIVLSSSALQWSKDLQRVIKIVSNSSEQISMVLFTANTFKKIFEITGKSSPILDIDAIEKSFKDIYQCEFEVLNYKLEFDSKKEMFDYIKNSGVGGGDTPLSFKEAKKLYKEYPYSYLEFEVVFVKGKVPPKN